MLELIGEYHGLLMKRLNKVWLNKTWLTFLYYKSQNLLLKMMRNQVQLSIIKELKISGLFAV